MGLLSKLDLSLKIDDENYKKELSHLQAGLRQLTNLLHQKEKSLILVFEGWDAAGKGGSIKRITQNLDPRHYRVYPIAKPTEEEYARHYLWRFWTKIPHPGQIAIFDRSWYGRVLVERVEGFAKELEWQRAYREINEFEEQLLRAKIPIIKFFLHISPEEQLRRFRERELNPLRNWKITEEDWRNREKWPQYEIAIEEMLAKTSTLRCPWHLIEAEDKNYARIKIAKIFLAKLKELLKT